MKSVRDTKGMKSIQCDSIKRTTMKKSISLLFLFVAVFFQNTWAGGFIICRPPHHPNPHHVERYLEVNALHVKAKLTELTAQTTFEQTFYNPTYQRMEGEFLFPIPQGVHIEQFTMWINGKETEAELLDADKARAIYEEIVRSLKDPALLEYANQDMLRMRIFPIEPNSEQKVKVVYSETINKDDDIHEYVFPFQFNNQKVGKTEIIYHRHYIVDHQRIEKYLFSLTRV